MAIVRRRGGPGGPLWRLRDEMNDLFGRFFEDWPLAGTRQETWWPVLDIAEHEDAVVVNAELPGLKSDEIDISVQNNVLTISGQKKESKEEKGEEYYHVERRFGSFRRDVTLPASVDADKVEASYRDGVLTITLPKTEQAKPKRIEVKT
jgi:HSP20 family protein